MIKVKVKKQYYDATEKEMKHEGDVYEISEERYEKLKTTFVPTYFERVDNAKKEAITIKEEEIVEITVVDEIPEEKQVVEEVIIEESEEPKKKTTRKKARK